MALHPCSHCGQRVPGKIASSYNAWFTDDQTRVAYKQRFCIDCLGAQLVPVLKKELAREKGDTSCIECGGKTSGNTDCAFVTLYLPKAEAREVCILYCGECAPTIHAALSIGADRLEDRGVGVRGPLPSEAPDWGSQLGL